MFVVLQYEPIARVYGENGERNKSRRNKWRTYRLRSNFQEFSQFHIFHTKQKKELTSHAKKLLESKRARARGGGEGRGRIERKTLHFVCLFFLRQRKRESEA